MKRAIIAAALCVAMTASAAAGGHGHHYGHHHHHGRGWGWWGPGAVAGAIIIGGAVTAAAIAEHRARDADVARCARDFPSYRPSSGTFVDATGEVRVCPYLY